MINAIVRRIQLDRPKDGSEKIIKAINSLDEKEKDLLSLRFPWTLGEIGEKWGVSKQRVQAIEAKAIEKIIQQL